MHIELPAEQRAMVEGLVASGRFNSLNEAIGEAIELLVSREELKQTVQLGIEQADRGEIINHDTVFGQLRIMAAAAQQLERGE